jgi:hypothetical protein
MHAKECLAEAMIAAIQNLRDSNTCSDFDFRLYVQDNLPLEWADEYLADGTKTCICSHNS